MNDGFVRVMALTPDVKVADTAYDLEAARAAMDKAVQNGAALLVLPELCLTSRSCGDLFFQGALLDRAEKAAAEIAQLDKDYTQTA